MAVRNLAAPPTPWSRSLTEPEIHQTAYIHPSSNISGDVKIGANVLVAPGTSVRADEGHPFYIGEGTNVQDGVVIHGLEQGRVVGDDRDSYSVWIGNNVSITYMALIHGPAYVGDDCFIGFRSTVFNARLGEGCIVMMHALIQDVEIPPGKFVPSGSIITNQQQADRLPDVQESDLQFATHVVSINDALRSGYHNTENVAYITPMRNEGAQTQAQSGQKPSNHKFNGQSHQDIDMNSDVEAQVRQFLAQGYRIGTEFADERRFQTSSWKSGPAMHSSRAGDVLADLDAFLQDHEGEYVRLIAIDPKRKKRMAEITVQRPHEAAAQRSYTGSSSQTRSSGTQYGGYSNGHSSHAADTSLSSETIAQVRQLLAQGYRIGTEHADKRRFQTSSWHSCSPIEAKRESEVVQALEECMANHNGEYVRLIGIDPKAKRRVMEAIIQRPNGQSGNKTTTQSAPRSTNQSVPISQSGGGRDRTRANTSQGLTPDAIDQVRQSLAQGHQISTEYADKRRFQTSSWQSGGVIESRREPEVLSALENALAEHRNAYVRLISIDPKVKRRVQEQIIQRPAQ